jgi:hypothetical protein
VPGGDFTLNKKAGITPAFLREKLLTQQLLRLRQRLALLQQPLLQQVPLQQVLLASFTA